MSDRSRRGRLVGRPAMLVAGCILSCTLALASDPTPVPGANPKAPGKVAPDILSVGICRMTADCTEEKRKQETVFCPNDCRVELTAAPLAHGLPLEKSQHCTQRGMRKCSEINPFI